MCVTENATIIGSGLGFVWGWKDKLGERYGIVSEKTFNLEKASPVLFQNLNHKCLAKVIGILRQKKSQDHKKKYQYPWLCDQAVIEISGYVSGEFWYRYPKFMEQNIDRPAIDFC